MGVPKFYRFIRERYPLISAPLHPSSAPTIDNLYLDMNGIIHNCVRSSPGNGESNSSSASPTVKSDQQIFLDVFKYIDNIVTRLPPRRVLHMAVDGVAPRAKMNQQRARRFRSAKERLDEHRRKMEEDPMYAAAEVEPFDSNCITPGTSFMSRLTVALKYFVAKKISEDAKWGNIDVILSGAEAPGEGEHKIMEYIRAMRESGQLPPNTRHCVYGLDADLIMLGLVTHEPHFFILREKVNFNFWRKKSGPRLATSLDTATFGDFELLSIGVLREYLVLELGADGNSALPFFDAERIADDFVFILMLIGNDFLPNLPTLDIADGTLNVMLHLYKRVLPKLGGYLTDSGRISPERLEYFFAKLGSLEPEVLRQRREEESSGSGRRGRKGARGKAFANVDWDYLFDFATLQSMQQPLSLSELKKETLACRETLADEEFHRMKEEYYMEKFGTSFVRNESETSLLMKSYIEGVAWTLKYYTEGCRQWRWFYPYHYAPLASDIFHVSEVLTKYEAQIVRDKPFKPFEQLLSVLPPVSSWCLPKPHRALMTSPSSALRDQYPEDFRIDMNGKRNDWEAVVLLPFVDEARLLAAVQTISVHSLTREECSRNEFGPSFVYRKDSRYSEVLHSPFGSRMPSFTSQGRGSRLVLPSIADGQSFRNALAPATKLPGSCESLADLPTLNEVEHSSRLEAVGVNLFGFPSKSDSLLLIMDFNSSQEDKSTDSPTKSRGTAGNILERRGITAGCNVWCGFPWRIAAVVESVTNEFMTKRVFRGGFGTNGSSDPGRIEARKTDKGNFARGVSTVVSSLLQQGAISVSLPKQVVAIRREDEVGTSRSEAKDNQTVLFHEQFVKLRLSHEPTTKLGAHQRLSKGQAVLYVGHGAYFGHKCTVVALNDKGSATVQFRRSAAAAREPAFGYRVVSICTSQQRWMTLSRLAAAIGLSVPVVDQFLGSFRVQLISAKEEIDLGIGVKYIGRGLYVPGFARREERNYFSFSEKCADVLRKYRASFPDLFVAVDRMKTQEAKAGGGRPKANAIYGSKELFPGKRKADDAVRAVSTWISMQDVASQPLVSTQADVLPKHSVLELEKHCSIVLTLQAEYDDSVQQGDAFRILRDLPEQALLTGNEGLDWEPKTKSTSTVFLSHDPVPMSGAGIRLGDRVVNRLGSGGVPFGLRGTVVGIHQGGSESGGDDEDTRALVEVTFDEGFISGGTLSGRCSEGRGKVVPANTLFIVRPDRDNAYYVKNYARVAAQVGLALKRDEATKSKTSSRLAAVEKAAVISYSEAVKKKPTAMSPAPPVSVDDFIAEITQQKKLLSSQEGVVAKTDVNTDAFPEGPLLSDVALPMPSFLRSTQVGSAGAQRLHAVRPGKSDNEHDDSVPAEADSMAQELRRVLDMPSASQPSERERQDSSMSRGSSGGQNAAALSNGDEDEFASLWRQLQQNAKGRFAS